MIILHFNQQFQHKPLTMVLTNLDHPLVLRLGTMDGVCLVDTMSQYLDDGWKFISIIIYIYLFMNYYNSRWADLTW